jgi:GxxExxY protein
MDSDEKPQLPLQDVTQIAIGCFYGTYNDLSGFPEYVVVQGLAIAFEDAGLNVRREMRIPVWFRGRRLTTFRADLVIDPGVIIEVKCAPSIEAFHKAQLMHYLKATDFEVGLLFNFGRDPQFSRVIYQNARKSRTTAAPGDLEHGLEVE